MRIFKVFKNSVPSIDMGPRKKRLTEANNTLKCLKENKEWFCGGMRSAAVAAELLLRNKIIALPTDTIYGLAGLAQNNNSIAKLYEIKKRDANKPLAICLGDVNDIEKWAHTKDLPNGLVDKLLPGPTTIILQRKETLNPSLNPEVKNVGIRIPRYKFALTVAKMVNQPIALTSANLSGKMSTLHPNEFKELWPLLDGVFFEKMSATGFKSHWRKGSTIVDLSIKGEYEIIRKGISYDQTLNTLEKFDLKKRSAKEIINKIEENEEKEIEVVEKAKVQALS